MNASLIENANMSAHARASLPGCLVGFGDPVVDIMVRVSEAFLSTVGDEGGSVLVSEEEISKLRADSAANPDTNGGEARCGALDCRCMALEALCISESCRPDHDAKTNNMMKEYAALTGHARLTMHIPCRHPANL